MDSFENLKLSIPQESYGTPKYKDLPPPPPPDYSQCKIIKDKDKFDCFPEDGASKEKCEARGCCWMPRKIRKNQVPLDVPYCFYPSNFPSYYYENITETAFGLVAFLKRNYRTPFPNDIETIKMIVKYETETRLHIKVKSHFRLSLTKL